jgi:hypothetical protein
LEYGADPHLASDTSVTPFTLAKERFHDDHPVMRTYMEFVSDKPNDNVDEWKEAQHSALLEKKKRLFEEAEKRRLEAETKQKQVEKVLQERRKKLFRPILDDDNDEDVETARERLDDLLNQPPRKAWFVDDEL